MEQAIKNRDGADVCKVCGSKTYDPNIAYCSPEHAAAAGATQVISTAVIGENNSDNPPDGSLSDTSQFASERRAEEMVRAQEAETRPAAGYVEVDPETGKVGSEVLHGEGQASESGVLVESTLEDTSVNTGAPVSDDRPGGNDSEADWREYRLAHGYTAEELEGKGRNALRDLEDR